MLKTKNQINGIVLVDKPECLTSHDVVFSLKKKFNTKKVGHFGTLDPLATGLLVVGVGGCTKIEKCLDLDIKTYESIVEIGIETDTLDTTGKVLKTSDKKVDKNTLLKELSLWKKTYLQTVPIYSAVKVDGKKLYEYARNGEEVILPTKNVTIYDIKFLDMIDDTHFSFRVTCSKGTYIRSLIKDIGTSLDVLFTMSNLRRVRQGDFLINSSKTLDEITIDDIKPIDEILNVTKVKLETYENNKQIISGNEIKSDITSYILFLKEEEPFVLYGPSKKHEGMLSPIFFF